MILTSRQWSVIDGCMDNVAALMPVDSPASDHERPVEIRRAGSRPERLADAPSGEPVFTIQLQRDQWEYVVQELLRSAPIYEQQMGVHEPDHETAEWIRATADAVARQLP